VYAVIEPFEDKFPAGRVAKMSGNSRSDVVRFCPELECTATFITSDDLEDHILSGQHDKATLPTKEDQYKAYYLHKLKTGALIENPINKEKTNMCDQEMAEIFFTKKVGL